MKRVLFLLISLMIASSPSEANLSKYHSILTKKKSVVSEVLAGNTNQESNGVAFWGANNGILGFQYTAIASGNLATGYWYAASTSTNDTKIVVYDSSENLIAESSTLTSLAVGWNEYTFSSGSITSGQTYRICIFGDGDNVRGVKSGDSASMPYDSQTFSSGATDPWVQSGSMSDIGAVSIYVKS